MSFPRDRLEKGCPFSASMSVTVQDRQIENFQLPKAESSCSLLALSLSTGVELPLSITSLKELGRLQC